MLDAGGWIRGGGLGGWGFFFTFVIPAHSCHSRTGGNPSVVVGQTFLSVGE
jgi:hypothetical protein